MNKVFWRAKEMREGASQGDSKIPMKKINEQKWPENPVKEER